MSLSAGTKLGPYEIISALGAGGMGEIYRARDKKLNRDVALKVLPDAFARDPERLARFQREAQLLASLSHPNVGGIYELEESGDVRALVMELVEGEDLARRIARGAIPLDEALPIAHQIADALEAAHEQGIIHRDLKPSNIKLRPDGAVKVLDFGLAKALDPLAADSGSRNPASTNSPTMTSPVQTHLGVILGTAAYMSPEQARGKPADKRADIWAFGCVLYEMLTGRRAFTGDEVSDVLARILEREPDFGGLPPATPTAIRRLLRRCLEKDRKRRLDSATAARLEIDEALTSPAEPIAQAVQPRRSPWRVVVGTALLTGAVVATAATLYVRRSTPVPLVTRLEVSTPATPYSSQFVLSPDGRRLALATGATGPAQVAVRSFDQVDMQILVGTEGGGAVRYPFWSPDGRAIGFSADGRLKRVDLSGGPPLGLADTPNFRGGTWNEDGVIVFAPSTGSGLMRVSAAGGTPVAVTHLAPGQGGHVWPQFLPDGRHFLFLVMGGQPADRGIFVASLDGGEPIRVVASDTAAAFSPPGYLLRVSQGILIAQRFDPVRATLSGDPVPIAQAVGENDGNFHSAFSVSAAGILAHRSVAGGGGRRQLVWFDRTGKAVGTVGPPDENSPSSPALAPDGKHVANGRTVQGNVDIWLTEVARGVATRFTFDPATDYSPIWSADGRQVVFRSIRNGPSDLFIKPASGATDEQPLLVTQQSKAPLDWSRDGSMLLYSSFDAKTQSDLWILPLTGERKPFPVVQTGFEETQGQFSPDGRWLAYTSNESGRDEIYVRPSPEAGSKFQISTGGGSQPRWRPDGNELFYIAADAMLMAVPLHVVSEGRAVDAGAPIALFPTRLAVGAGISLSGYQSRALYAVGRDGQFLMNVQIDTGADNSPLRIVQNWDAGLTK